MLEFIPQAVLNLLVIISTIATIYQSRINCKPVFIFILNQAMADFALAIAVVIVVDHRYRLGDPVTNTDKKCLLQISIWMLIVINSILSTIMLTLDRFLYITTTVRYPIIMRTSRVILALAFCWLIPILYSLLFIFTYGQSNLIRIEILCKH